MFDGIDRNRYFNGVQHACLDGVAGLSLNAGKGNPNHDELGRSTTGGGGGKKPKPGKVSHKRYEYKVRDWDADDPQAKKTETVAEWDETTHPIYQDSTIIKTGDQLGMIPDRAEFGIAEKAYIVRDKRLEDPFEAYVPIDDKEEKYVKDYLKATFKIDNDELERLLKGTHKKAEW